jgi:ribosomal-protein-alanine N-acetyltransferase
MSNVGVRTIDRLRLEPIGPQHADDLLALYRDPAVAEWYGEWTSEQIEREAARMARGWLVAGVHKWMAFDRFTGERIGRGGLSRAHIDGRECFEIGWALHRRFWGHGYATEIGRAGLAFAFDELAAEDVLSFTEVHNWRSRAVMERLGFSYSKDISIDSEPFALYVLDRSQRSKTSTDSALERRSRRQGK